MSRYDELLDRNKYDAILDAPQTQLRTAVRGSIGRDPDQTAEVVSLSARTGVPAPIVERNRDLVAQQEELTRYDSLLERSPEVARFLSEPENAAVARDDVSSLSGLEWATRAPAAAHSEQWKTVELGTLRARQIERDLTPEENARVTQLKSEITGSDFGAENWFEKILVETGRLLPTMEYVLSESMKTGALTGLGFGGVAAVAGQAGPQVLAPEELITVPAAGALGFRMGSAAGAAKASYEIEAGLALDEFLDIRGEDGQPIDVGVARNAAALVGTVNAALEVTGLATLARFMPGLRSLVGSAGKKAVTEAMKRATFRAAVGRLATGYVVGVGTEVATEVAQEATAILGAEIAKGLSPGQFEGTTAEAVGARLAEIAIKTTQGMAIIGGVGPGAQFVGDAQRAQQAQRNQAVFEALGQHATDSKLRQRLPERFQAYVARLREGGEVQDIRIPVEEFATYFQTQGLDPAEVAREVTGSDAAYTEAQAAGTDLVIPLEAYATKLAPTDHHAALMPNLRLRADEMTAREAEQWREQSETLTQELAGMAPGQATPRPVYDDVLGQLLASGIERGAAEQNAQLMASVFETLGSRTGTDPMALYEQYGLQVRQEVPAVLQRVGKLDTDLDPLIDRLRAGKLPTDREVFGPSLVEFLLEKGGLQDQGGELAARDAQKSFRGLVKKEGRTFDEATELAAEAGYLAQGSTQNELLAALDRELKGEGVFQPNALNQQLLDLRTALDDLGDYLGRQGVDLAQTDNAAVRNLLQSATTLDQQQLDMFASTQAATTTEPAAAEAAAKPEPEPAPAAEETAAEPDIQIERGATDDAGEELWYNRRNATGKALTWSDVETLNPALKVKETTKTKVWPRPNYEQLIDDGLEPVAANLIKQVYDSIATKPASTKDEHLKLYIEGVEQVRDATFDFVRKLNMEEVEAKLEAVIASGSGYAWAQKTELSKVLGVERRDNYSGARFPLVDKVFPLEEGNNAALRFRGGDERATRNNTLANLIGGNKLIKELSIDAESVVAAAKAVNDGWPKPQEAWQKRFKILKAAAGEKVYSKGQTRVLDADEFMVVQKKGRRILAEGFKTIEEATEAARALTKREGGGGPAEESMSLDKARREGVPRREGDVTSEKLMETFGFRGINFGNWMKGNGNEAERQAHLNNAFDSFADLAALLNVPPLAMSLNGLLGIAFGAQGRGGGAAAHFVPGVNEINLTRESGAGSLAHEWGHALDHYFNTQIGEEATRSADPFLTETVRHGTKAPGGLRPEIMQAFRAIVKTMKERDETPEEVAARIKSQQSAGVKRLQGWLDAFRSNLQKRAKPEAVEAALKEFDALAAKIIAGDLGEYAEQSKKQKITSLGMARESILAVRTLFKSATGSVPSPDEMKGLAANADHVRYLIQADESATVHKPQAMATKYGATAYRRDQAKGGKAYWATPWEMFARAFESYVLDRLEDQAIRNDYLVGSNKGEKTQEAMIRLGIIKESAYPAGEERIAINAAFDDLLANIKHEPTEKGVRLFQKFEETRRGSIEFGAVRKFTINLLKNRDLSTFLHESGHLYLEVLGDLAESSNAPEQIVQDYASILKWFGVEARQAIKVEHHEKFARGFEAYLYEGKAPSVELQNAFARFRAWLVSIYRQLKALNVDLNKEVRDVFDRLIATDDAIVGAEEAQNYVPIFTTAESAGMTQPQFDAYRKTVQDARLQAEDDLSRKLLAVTTREQKQWWKDRRKEVGASVTAEVHGMRVYRALSFLRFGTNPDGTEVTGVAAVKLDKAALTDEFRYPMEFLKRLPGAGKNKVYAAEGGVHPDIVATMFGYRGTSELVTDLVNARPMKDLIEAETDAKMRELYPDPLVDGSLADDAIQAVHSGKRGELLAAELRALKRKALEVGPFVRAAQEAGKQQQRQALEANRAQMPDRNEYRLIRAAAERTVNGKRVRDISPSTYRVAEAKASRAAFAAAAKGDYQVAYFEKRKQLLNHELYLAAEQAVEDSESIRDYFRSFAKKGKRERIGKANDGSLEKIEALLASIDLGRITNKVIDRRVTLEGIRQQIANGDLMADPETIKRLEASVRNWRELSYDELVGLQDVVKQLEHQATELSEAIVNGERVKIKESAEAVAVSVRAGNKSVGFLLGTPRLADKGRRAIRQSLYSWLRPAELARQLDGGQDFGATLRTIIEPIRRAYAEKLIPAQRKIREDVAGLYQAAYKNEELSALNVRGAMPEIDANATKGDLLSLALNWGNAGNRQALLDSTLPGGRKPFTEAGISQALGRLTAKDWAFVQSVWDYIDTYWPQLAATEKRRRGVAPRKVEAASFTVTTADGQRIEIRGGYYPLKYDPLLSAPQRADQVEQEFSKFVSVGNLATSTRAGSTIERVGSGGRPVRLGLGVIDQHLNEVVRDLSIGDEARFVYRILQRPEIKGAMAETGNEDAHETLKMWLKDAAVGEMAAHDFPSQAAAWARIGFTKAKLAWNVTTTLLQITGLPQTMVVVGPKAFSHGVGRYLANPMRAHRELMAESAFMRARYQENAWNKDVQDTKTYLESFLGPVPTKFKQAVNALSYSYFWPIAKVQMVVDGITWTAGYWKGVHEKGLAPNSQAAIAYADSMVENAQTSGFFVDRSAIERGSLSINQRQSQFVKLWTTLISYMLAKGNIAYAKGRQFRRAPSFWSATTLAGDMVALFAIEAILAGAIRGTLPDDDDDESWLGFVAKESAASAISGVPFVREITSGFYGSGNTPIGGLANDFAKALTQTAQGEADVAAFKAWNNLGGTLFHYPSTQINRAVEALWLEAEGEDVAPYEYLTGPRKD